MTEACGRMECISNDVALGEFADAEHVSEDSVDIYGDLDLQAVSSSEKSPPTPSGLQASMDLYEDIVREEQQGRESSYADLKSRFHAAQNQIKELRRRLEQMELQNTGLNTENHLLKKNISALLRTARQEVMRKDAEIQRLNQSSGRGLHHHHSQMNDPNSWQSLNSSLSKPPKPSMPTPSPNLCSPPQTSSTREDRLPKVQLEPPRKESGKTSGSCPETRPSSHSHSKCSSVHDVQKELATSNSVSSSTWHHWSDKHKSKHKEEKCQKLFDSTDRKYRTGLDSSHTTQKVRSHELDRERRHDSRTSKSRDYQNVGGHRRAESAKSQPVKNLNVVGSLDDLKGRTHEKKHRSSHSYSEDQGRHSRKIKMSDEKSSLGTELKRSDSKDQKRSSVSLHTESRRGSSKEKQKNRHSDEYERKGDKQREDKKTKSHKRNTAPETKREGDTEPSEERHNNKPDANNKESQGKKHAQTSTKEPLEDKSENRKLCFMETLNLTLSPNKKLLPNTKRDDGLAALPPLLDKEPDGEMYVIDQIDNSELQACLEELSTDSAEAHISETLMKEDVKKDVQKRETCPEDTAVQATSCLLSQDSAVDEMPSHVTPKAQVNGSVVQKDIPDSQLDIPKQVDATDCASVSGKDASPFQKPVSANSIEQCIAVTQGGDSRLAQDRGCADKVMECLGTINPVSTPEDPIHTHPERRQLSHITRAQGVQLDVHPPASSSPANDKNPCHVQDDPQDANTVSSTMSLESVPQEGLSLPEAIYVLTCKDGGGGACLTTDQVSSVSCIGVSNVSSTTEEISPPEQYCELTVTPKKSLCEKSREKNVEPSCPMPFLLDEDSMMRTLSNLKTIPDAISPLRSPIHVKKRSRLLTHGKLGHVKSLQKEFSSTACDANPKNTDLNKENKYPGYPLKHAKQDLADKLPEMPSNLSDTELEEGEILSESDEASSDSPLHPSKRVKSGGAVRSKASPKSLLEKKKCEERTPAASASTQQSPGSKSRFKTVCPVSTKTSFATVEEVIETFKLVRLEIRKKYMKLHRTFPKRSFCGVMENFRESFVQFVEGAHFGQICCEAVELKSKLKVLIVSMFNKVADNGIVKRIFDQQAVDLKQKLWDFVDVQLDYLLKDIYATLKNLCRAVRTLPEKNRCRETDTRDSKGFLSNLDPVKPCVAPYKTGLGSRGKDIRITHAGKQKNVGTCSQNGAPTDPGGDSLSPKKPSVSEKMPMAVVVKSQSTSSLDKTDFELLTEQQASSLTFNLVRDSQMGEIFKCLLQGSDLLEPSVDSTSLSLATPKKIGETVISITTPNKFDSPAKFLSPTKFDTPSKLIATWSSISPRNLSPQAKDHIRTNPFLFDESCLLEVPSENKITLQSGFLSQLNYSSLAEDLEVSLTIPSPLKSDSHLSFLQPSGTHTISTPDSVISAHISEDALLDGEDATEQDIHLALDTDNSSSGSSCGVPSQAAANAFVLKPELLMQALVMEKSNDHFIVKIRQGTTQTLAADETLSPTQTGEDAAEQASPCNEISEDLAAGVHGTSGGSGSTEDDFRQNEDPIHSLATSKPETDESQKVLASGMDKNLTATEEDVHTDPEKDNKDCDKRIKRKKHQEHSKAKRPRKDQKAQMGDVAFSCKNESSAPSPNSFSAMNVIKRKGAVVMAWTRDEDRAILIDLKTKGASRETFADLSDKLKKPSEQIAQRFYQLMKLFKKQGKMDV